MQSTHLSFPAIWQTALAVPLAILVYVLGMLIGGGLFAFFSGAPIIPGHDLSRVWFLSAAAWIGVWTAYHACEWLFSSYIRWIVVLVLALIALADFIGEIGQPIFWDVIARGAQGGVTCLTAYAFFCHQAGRRKRLQP